MKNIDIHAHIGEGAQMKLAVDDLLRFMDEADVAIAVVSPMDRQIAVDNREGNDFVIRAVQTHPDRLAGMAVANPWYGRRATDELRRALDAGLIGLKLHSVLQGFRLSDPLVHPLLAIADERQAPVYAHTGTAGMAEPFQLIELARQFPSLPFIMGHAAASDYYWDANRGLEFAENVWMETSRNGPGNYMQWKRLGLIQRVVFGSNAPEYIPALELATLRDVFDDPADQARICAEAARLIFKEKLPS